MQKLLVTVEFPALLRYVHVDMWKHPPEVRQAERASETLPGGNGI